MPYRRSNANRRRRPRRRLMQHAYGESAAATAMIPLGRSSSYLSTMGHAARTAQTALEVANAAHQHAVRIQKVFRGMKGKQKTKALKQTKLARRGKSGAGAGLSKNRHEKLKSGQASGKVNKGKGYNKRNTGVIVTHPVLPRWKKARARKYNEGNVWQTVLLSKSSRIPNSNNILKTFRYPIKAPECLDSERVQAMVFSPFCSHYTGIHSTYYRNVRADGTDLEHATAQPLDVIQNMADKARHDLPAAVDGVRAANVEYEREDVGGNLVTAADTQLEISNTQAYYDQMLKNIKIDLVFMSSRAFPVRVSVSVVRHIQPTAPYYWTTEDKQQLLNNLDNKGLEWNSYKVEFCHEFVLPALRKGKAPPTRHVKKILKTHFMQTNTFNENNTAEDMSESSLNQLGLGLRRRVEEVADGFVSGMCYILIKYRKVQQPQQFTYSQAIDTSLIGQTGVTAHVEVPAITEESFDIPTNGAAYASGDGSPFKTDQGDESKASFYLHGTLKYNWGFREQTENIPSIMSEQTTDSHYKKSQSLNIDPTIGQSGAGTWSGDTTYGLYTQSPSHQTKATAA